MKMTLNEALETLNKSGFVAEQMNEGLIGRALGIGALAISTLFSTANSMPQKLADFGTDDRYVELTNEEIPLEYEYQKRQGKIDKVIYDTKKDGYILCNKNKDDVTCKISAKDEITTATYENGVRTEVKGLINSDGGVHLAKATCHDNGQVKKIVWYYDKNGSYVDEIYYYDEAGNITKHETYYEYDDVIRSEEDYKTHTGVEYYTTGEIKTEYTIDDDGDFHGILKMYRQDGKYAGKQKYEHGKPVGMTTCVDGRRGRAGLDCQIPLQK